MIGSGQVVAFHRYATAGEGSEISLDVGFRRPGAPNGVDERLSVDMIASAKSHNGLRLSLAFAAFPEIFDARPAPVRCSVSRIWLIHLLDPLIRLESLYRYLHKFHSLAERRYVVLCAHHIPGALVVLLSLEFMPRPAPSAADSAQRYAALTSAGQSTPRDTGRPREPAARFLRREWTSPLAANRIGTGGP